MREGTNSASNDISINDEEKDFKISACNQYQYLFIQLIVH